MVTLIFSYRALQYAGFAVFPILGSALAAIYRSSKGLLVDKFTAPSLVLVGMGLVCILALILAFEDIPAEQHEKLDKVRDFLTKGTSAVGNLFDS